LSFVFNAFIQYNVKAQLAACLAALPFVNALGLICLAFRPAPAAQLERLVI